MNRCSVCAREIPETKTVCETCGRWAAEPIGPAETSAAEPRQPTRPEPQPSYTSPKVAQFPAPEHPAPKPVPPVTPLESSAAPVVPDAPDTPAEVVETVAAPAAAPTAVPMPVPSAKRKAGGTLVAPAALAMLKGHRGAVAGLGIAATLAIAFLVARPAPPENAAGAAKPPSGRSTPFGAPQGDHALDVKWSVGSKRWGANQKKSIALELPALNRVPVWTRHVTPVLVVRCVAKATEAFVFTESPMAMEPDTPDHTVRLTFDDAPQKTERWPDSIEHDSLFAPDGEAFARRLLTARTLQFGFTPHNSPAVVVQFQVNGLRGLIEPAAKDCGWK